MSIRDDGVGRTEEEEEEDTRRVEQAITEYWLTRDRLYPCLDPVEIVTLIRHMGCKFEVPEPYSPHNTCNS
jgi:hypothetical protein